MLNIENIKLVRDIIANGKEGTFNMEEIAMRPDGQSELAGVSHTERALMLIEGAESGHVLFGDCASAGCIAGWALVAAANAGALHKSDLDDDDWSLLGPLFQAAGDFMGLGEDQRHELFLDLECTSYLEEAKITREEALETIDRLIATGEVLWPKRVRDAADWEYVSDYV